MPKSNQPFAEREAVLLCTPIKVKRIATPIALAEALADRCFQIEVRDETQLMTDVWLGAGEDTLRGCFLRVLKKKYDAAPEEAKAGITLAARYGLAALDYREDL